MAMHEIDIDRVGWKICHDCVDEIWMGGKPEKFKEVGNSTVYRKENCRRTNKKWRVQCLYMEVNKSVYCLLYILVGWLMFHHLVIFHLLVIILKLIILIFLSLLEHVTFNSI